jgi:hypothetical protein
MQVRIGGNMALMRGVAKAVFEAAAADPGVLDGEFRVLRWTATANSAGLYTGLPVAASRSTALRCRSLMPWLPGPGTASGRHHHR